MDRKVLTISDITTFNDLNSKIIDGIYKYVEHKYPNIKDFWVDCWDILDNHIYIEVGTEESYIEDVVDIDEFLKICNN